MSSDDAGSWKNHRLLEAQRDWPLSRTWCYPSVAFMNDHAHVTYYEKRAHPTAGAHFELIYRRLPIAWFYEEKNL